MIAIHKSRGSFSERWISYCEEKGIEWKAVDCYRSDIQEQLAGCTALMWHFHQNSPKSILFAKQLLYSLELSNFKVFPGFRTVWHFDDKVGQKYLLSALDVPFVPTRIFFEEKEALLWIESATFPKVFKLRTGAGSQNVRLIDTKRKAKKLINKAFRRGFLVYEPYGKLKESWRLFRLKKAGLGDLMKGMVRLVIPPNFARLRGRERGYIYFQDFIPSNQYDIRVIVIEEKAFAIKRLVRKNDFRASGSGNILYDRHLFDEQTIILSFEMAEKIKSQCIAFDFVYDKGKPLVVEISYGFSPEGYDKCPGYWDKKLIWHEGEFNPYGWMVDSMIKQPQDQPR